VHFWLILTKKLSMKRIVEFPLEDGDSIFVEVDEPAQTDSRIGIPDDRIGISDRIFQKSTQSFESAFKSVKPIANAILDKVNNLNQPADEVEVKFGIRITAGLKAVVASGDSEVNYEITLKWNRGLKDESRA
jgi:hypothetical protein